MEAAAANTERLAVLTDLATEATQELELRTDVDTLVSVVAGEEERLSMAIDTSRREQSAVQGRLDSVTEALNALRSADAECPVCRRPLSEGDAVYAGTAHSQEAAALAAQLEIYSDELAILSTRLRATRDISRRLHVVPPPRDAPPADSLVVPAGDLEGFRLKLRDLSETSGALKSQTRQIEGALEDSIAARNEQARAVQLYRREAIAGATRNTLEATVRSLLAVNVEPVAQEVTARWKRIFGERGSLELSPDGELSLMRGGFMVPFEDFSSGEKVIALLTARLLITAASTRASFMWLDEPLEHLDPANRRIVASLLATATAPLRQVIVTTYEEPLARRLAEQVPTVHLTYVRATDD
jgi:DNA repair exonuclease SbcCD ATPase subunit